MGTMSETCHEEDSGAQLIARLAARVSEARKLRGIPRRVLSERSGVSPRYLAQLEAGKGNISVLLLYRVAAALDLKIDALLAQETTIEHDAERIATLYRDAPSDVRDKVRDLLMPRNPALLRAGRICLIGLRGAGKSTLGRLAGEALKIPFVELNEDIERAAGMPLAEIMAFYGESGYRKMEAEALDRVCAAHDRLILAVAGGIVAEASTYARLLDQFHSVWIRTSPAEHMQRVRAQGDVRPMEGNPQAMGHLKDLLLSREALYGRASAQVDTSNKPINSSLNELLAVIANRGFLEPGP